MTREHFDVLVVGAGISGIGAGYHLGANCPDRTYAILEGRPQMGGTWDLFRYPGVRSDSDMYTLGYSFKPWTDAKAIADGPAILNYLHETAKEFDIDRHIRYRHQVKSAAWSTEDAAWTIDVEIGEDKQLVQMTCNFLFMCSGYYSYKGGYSPEFPGTEKFQGQIIHPQKWPKDISYKGKRVIVIGSGATAVTLIPEMAKDTAHITMLQRSPTYIVSRPAEDALANTLRRWLPPKLAYGLTRWKNVLMGMYFFHMARKKPTQVKAYLLKMVRKEIGDALVKEHFTPTYNPWDQRLCLVPNGDLFDAIKTGAADVVTDRIETFTEKGIKLQSGKELEADIIVTATGLNLEALSGLDMTVDGKPVDISKTLNYKGMMYSDVPNMASSFGYTNASWTLKSDLTCGYVCRLLNYMAETGYRQCTPHNTDPTLVTEPVLNFTSGYVQRSIDKLPKQGSHAPWRLYQNYVLDIVSLKFGRLEDGAMTFSNRTPARNAAA